jgi:hypothetical protein
MIRARTAMAGNKLSRTYLSADGLVRLVRAALDAIDIPRPAQSRFTIADAAMSAFAMFALKDPSLLAFDERRNERNLESLYRIVRVPCDTQMRVILDEVPSQEFRRPYRDVFRALQRGKVLEQYVYLDNAYLLSLDGTGYFSSDAIHCGSCMEKKHANGRVSYYHQMLGAVIVHPERREVIPLCPEPIIKQDGHTKNDCERNAARRFLAAFRKEHPHLPVIVVEDGLSSNGPHIEDLVAHKMHFILGAKEGDHASLFTEFRRRLEDGEFDFYEFRDLSRPNVRHLFTVVRDIPLNASHPEIRVNMLDYKEITRDSKTGEEKVQSFTWVTDLALTRERVFPVMRAGRARWKVENETFNTLKNQGYHFEHNFGHGYKNLSVVFALLMMLAFLVDQAVQICDPLFTAALNKFTSKRSLWDRMRALFRDFTIRTLAELFGALAYGYRHPPIQIDTS